MKPEDTNLLNLESLEEFEIPLAAVNADDQASDP